MLIQIVFAFIAGIVTILSPCILPVLPIVLSGSIGGKSRPWGVVTGFVLSFTFFTLFLSSLVQHFGLPSNALRLVSIILLLLFGITQLLPQAQALSEKLFSLLANKVPVIKQGGFVGGLLVGLSLGLVWTPCVGPILASVIALAATGTVSSQTFAITLAYAVGTAIPMLVVMRIGRLTFKNSLVLQKLFGLVMILTSLVLFLNLDRQFQTWITSAFPSYGANLTTFEQQAVKTLATQGQAPELIAGGKWFNSSPLKLSELKGKVVLIDFWTYTCINCLRTLPYNKAWYAKYKDQGLVIIGVHTPEFEFEHEATNVDKAIHDLGITYPVMQDNNYATWNAYRNNYWPAIYLINKDGNIVYSHFGEGDEDKTEKEIQQALGVTKPINNPTYSVNAQTPETYVGSSRFEEGRFTTTGTWTIQPEYAQSPKGGTLTFPYYAKDIYVVMKTSDGKPGRVSVNLDGKLIQTISVQDNKLYDLVKMAVAGSHSLKLEFLDENIQLFAFTFG